VISNTINNTFQTYSSKETPEVDVFGRTTTFEYSEHWVGYSLFILRLVMGWTLFQGGVTKLVTYIDGDPETGWTAAGYLANAIPASDPFIGVWSNSAGSPLIEM